MTDLVCLEYAPNDDDTFRYLSNDGFIYVPNDAMPCPFPLCGDTLEWFSTATCTVSTASCATGVVFGSVTTGVIPQGTTAGVAVGSVTVTVETC